VFGLTSSALLVILATAHRDWLRDRPV